MVTNSKGVGRDESLRMDQLSKKFEVCQVYRVWTHNKPEDKNWQTCDVIIQDSIPLNPSGVGGDGPAVRLRVPIRQGHIGNRSGTPWTPRVGDSVLVGFYMNDRPTILGTLPPQHQLPVCRSSANPSTSNYGAYEDWVDADYHNYYDWRFKLVQWLHIPRRSITGADGKTWYTTFDHSQVTQAGKLRPVCFNYFDKTRDCMAVFECKKGKADPDNCQNCTLNGDDTGEGPDYIEEESELMSSALAAMNMWLKILSTDYEGTDDEPRRVKLHFPCGSVMCVDSNENDAEVEGRIWTENQVRHVPKGHYGLKPTGTFRASSHRTAEYVNDDSLLSVYGPDETVSDQYGVIAWELVLLTKMNYVRGYRDGSVRIQAATSEVEVISEIYLNADGSCGIGSNTASAGVAISAGGVVTITATELNLNATTIKQNDVAIHPAA